MERTTYDRLECTAQHQVFPLIGEKIVGDITAADLKSVLNHWMEQGYAYTTVKKVHILLNEYFRYLTEEDFIQKNPMQSRAHDEESQLSCGSGQRVCAGAGAGDGLYTHRDCQVQAGSFLYLYQR